MMKEKNDDHSPALEEIDVSEDNHKNLDKADKSVSRSRSRSQEKSQQRWLYCCSKCKKSGNKGKNCVCVVPATQRRISINKEGCSVCSCSGCSKEDVQLRQEKKKDNENKEKEDLEEMRNGCCKECMKAFSSKGKACICQVPASVRRRKLPDGGCLFCGCAGCNPEDKHKSAEKELKITRENGKTKFIKKTSGRNKGGAARRRRSGSRSSKSRSISRSQSMSRSSSRSNSRSRDSQNGHEEQLDNFNNSYIGNFLRNTFNIYPPLMGFGIPQRTYSYIYGKPPH